jgi:hypothetical protein
MRYFLFLLSFMTVSVASFYFGLKIGIKKPSIVISCHRAFNGR